MMRQILRGLTPVILLLLLLGSCSDMGEPEVLLPQIMVNTTQINFSSVTIGSPQTRHIQIHNAGEGDLNGELVLTQDSSAFTLVPQGSFMILPGDTLVVELRFNPAAEFDYVGQITVQSDDLDHPEYNIALSGAGTALPVPGLSLSTNSLNFGTSLTTESTQRQITLSSTGTDTLRISAIDFDQSVFGIAITTPFQLPPDSSLLLTLTFEPDGAGTYDATMTIHSNSPSTPETVDLTAVAEAPVSYAFSVQPVFSSKCTGCHGTSGGLNLSSYSNLMLGNSNNGPVVTPLNGENSLLIRKLRGEAGSRMPLNGPALADATIATIETWINQGALDN